MGVNIFPPIVDSYQPAFVSSIENYPIYFNFSDFTNKTEVKNIQIKISYQNSNENAVNTVKYPDGIIYIDANQIKYDKMMGKNYINLQKTALKENWIPGTYYKIQLRLGTGELYKSLLEFYQWKKQQVQLGNFSEWSTVLVLYPIGYPTLSILNNRIADTNIILEAKNTEITPTPTFIGKYTNIIYEPVEKYRFFLYDKETKELIEQSDWIRYDSSNDEFYNGQEYTNVFKHRFKHILQNNKEYTINYEIITRNYYQQTSKNYDFIISYIPSINENIELYSLDNYNNDFSKADEEGVIRIYLNSKYVEEEDGKKQIFVSGNYVLMRASEKDQYQNWEDLTYFTFANEIVEEIYEDYTIESGVKYKYKLEKENYAKLRTDLIEDSNTGGRSSNFSHSYFYNKGIQLKLKYNNSISSFKKNKLESKTDTLNSKFPYISRNGETNYSEFTINGLIVFDLVENQTNCRKLVDLKPTGELYLDTYTTFLNKIEGINQMKEGYYYKDELIIPKRKYSKIGKKRELVRVNNSIVEKETQETNIHYNSYNQQITSDNIYIERKFREKIYEFLQDGQPKLYKSPTEGNMIVQLLNVSLTPESGTNRILYNFSATAYEICECNYENLKKYNIITFNEYNPIMKEKEQHFGQILGYYEGYYSRDNKGDSKDLYPINNSKKQNLSDIIKKQVSDSMVDKRYSYVITNITSIQVESYPKISLENQILELDYKISLEKNKNNSENKELIEELINKKNYLEKLQKEIKYSGTNPFYTIIIDGKEINLSPNIPYYLKNVSIKDIYLKYSGAIMLNYICEVSTIESIEEAEKFRASIRTWNQIEGMFTDNKDVLINYIREPQVDLNDNSLNNKNIPNQISIYPYKNIGFYSTLDIMEIIKNKSKQEIENKQGVQFVYYNYLSEDKKEKEYYDIDRKYFYQFKKLESISIEGNPGTRIKIISYFNNENNKIREEEIIIGKTGKIKYDNNKNYLIKNILLSTPEYLIVDFSCEISLSEKGSY